MAEECFGPFIFESNDVETKIVDLQIIKQTCPHVLAGRDICYSVTVVNNSDANMSGILFSDQLDESVVYVAGTFEIDGEFVIPMMAGNTIQYPIDISTDKPTIIKFCVRVAD